MSLHSIPIPIPTPTPISAAWIPTTESVRIASSLPGTLDLRRPAIDHAQPLTIETGHSMQRLCSIDEIPDGGAIEVDDGDGPDTLVVMRFGTAVHAYLNICPHAGRPLNWAPGRFLIGHGQLVCAAHGAAFRPEDGHCIGGPCRGESLKAIALEIRDGEVWRLAQS
jgi:nitrite reductase/ring-hydroxylating ferredoxin subunit